MSTDLSENLIRSEVRMRQIRDFNGLRFGKISPTDIDCFLDFQASLFVFIETKHINATVPLGQRLALERICDACQSGKVDSWVLIATHETDGDIDVATTIVSEFRHHGHWRKPRERITTRSAIDAILVSDVWW